MLLDNGYLTDVRTAAAGAVAADHLARKDAATVAILGGGMQARLQLEALKLVRPISVARLWSRDADKTRNVARELSEHLSIPIDATAGIEGAVNGADIIVTTTPSTEPLLKGEHLAPGQHVTAMGSDAHNKTELGADVIPRADIYVPDSLAQVRERGELRAAIAAGTVNSSVEFPELGAVVAGQQVGRTSDAQITVADLTGTGVQDTAIAALATSRASEANAGTVIES